MDKEKWWDEFQEYASTLERTAKKRFDISRTLPSARRLFALLNEQEGVLDSFAEEDLMNLVNNVEKLLEEIHVLEHNSKIQKLHDFFHNFSRTIEYGLDEVLAVRQTNLDMKEIRPLSDEKKVNDSSDASDTATEMGLKLQVLEDKYHAALNAITSDTDGLDVTPQITGEGVSLLNDFLIVADYWLKQKVGLEYACRVLSENLKRDRKVVTKEEILLSFRIEPNKQTRHGFHVVLKKSPQYAQLNQDILNLMEDCYQIPEIDKDGRSILDNRDVIHFVRAHSMKDSFLAFRRNSVSRYADELCSLLMTIIAGVRQGAQTLLDLLNRTSINDLKSTFINVNPDDCKKVLRCKFQSLLPGLNEDHMQKEDKSSRPKGRTIRTVKTMNRFRKQFDEEFESMSRSFRSILAMRFWLRKILVIVIRDNAESNQSKRKRGLYPSTINVGASYTIGEEDIDQFHINRFDVTVPKRAFQHADKKDRWLAVARTEKTYRMSRKDFFSIIYDFYMHDLNPVLVKFGLKEVDLKNQLLPEVAKRVDDMERVEKIRSAILGTSLSDLESFCSSREFHEIFWKYFSVSSFEEVQYPYKEKFSQIVEGLSSSNASILQIKYRKILLIQRQLKAKVENLEEALQRQGDKEALAIIKKKHKLANNFYLILSKVLQIMEAAYPPLQGISKNNDN